MRKIILIGAGGHAKSCAEVINSQKKFKISLLVDKAYENKEKIKTILELDFLANYKLNKKKYTYLCWSIKKWKIKKKNF